MADALISLVVEELGAKATDELSLLIGVEKEVKKLSSMFTAIQAVLEDAEKQQVKNKNVRDWLGKLKEVAYEVEDILDEWRTDALIRSLTSLGDDNGDTSSGKKVSSNLRKGIIAGSDYCDLRLGCNYCSFGSFCMHYTTPVKEGKLNAEQVFLGALEGCALFILLVLGLYGSLCFRSKCCLVVSISAFVIFIPRQGILQLIMSLMLNPVWSWCEFSYQWTYSV